MTRDEAIEILRYLPINIGRQPGKHLIQEAMNMAIEALENNDKLAEDLQNCLEMYKKKKAEVKALERPHGKWIRITQGAIPEQYICPFCHRTVEAYGVEELLSIRYPYCHCGADMRERREDDEERSNQDGDFYCKDGERKILPKD